MPRNKTTEYLGRLSGPLLLFGGVYSNFQALEKMQEIAVELEIPASNVICTGDVVAYCAQPEEVVQSIMEWDIHCIAGNVEIQLREDKEDCGCDFRSGSRCDNFSQLWYPFAKTQLNASAIQWMMDLPDFISFQYAGLNAFVLHGSHHETAEYIFESTSWDIKKKNFEDTNADLIIGGHSGLPFHNELSGKIWLNPGVIGMPANDGTPRVWYMILDEKNGEIIYQHKTFTYDSAKAARLMNEKGLPPEYASTLESGIWDNVEILPEVEARYSGKKIIFTK